eukprot:g6085.t1
MSKPFYVPSARRLLDAFKGKHVMELAWGGSINFGGKIEYILVHGPGIKHGANSNITYLYHILRADLFDPKTMACNQLDSEVDGAGDNTLQSAPRCFTAISARCSEKIRYDQRHYVTRYFGWNKTMTTTNLAQALYKMTLGYRNSSNRRKEACLLLSTSSMAMLIHWYGEGGVPGGPQLKAYLRPPVKLRPTELPPENWVTQKKREDLYEIFKTGHMDGLYGDEGLPGYPAHLGPCVDRKGHAWLAKNIRVLADLPEGDLWASLLLDLLLVKHETRLQQMRKNCFPIMKFFLVSPRPNTPKHTQELGKASEEGLTEAEFGKVREVTVPKLKAYCKAKGLAVGGKKADLLSRIWEHAATQVEAQEEEESELDSQADDSDKVAEVLEGNALAGQSDLELSGSE